MVTSKLRAPTEANALNIASAWLVSVAGVPCPVSGLPLWSTMPRPVFLFYECLKLIAAFQVERVKVFSMMVATP